MTKASWGGELSFRRHRGEKIEGGESKFSPTDRGATNPSRHYAWAKADIQDAAIWRASPARLYQTSLSQNENQTVPMMVEREGAIAAVKVVCQNRFSCFFLTQLNWNFLNEKAFMVLVLLFCAILYSSHNFFAWLRKVFSNFSFVWKNYLKRKVDF